MCILLAQEHPPPDVVPLTGGGIPAVNLDGVAVALVVPEPSEAVAVSGLSGGEVLVNHFLISFSFFVI